MKKVLFLIPVTILANQELSLLDEYHIKISKWILDKSDAIDRYLSGENDDKNLSNTKLTLSYEIGSDNKGKISNNFDFSLSLNLPRFQKKSQLIFEKVIENRGVIGNSESLLSKSDINKTENNYNLAIRFSQWHGKKSSINFAGGVRFSTRTVIEPYVGFNLGYNIISNEKTEFNVKNSFRYYLAGECKNILSSQYLYNYRDDILLGWFGSFTYSNKLSNQYLRSEFIYHKVINDYKFYRVGLIGNAKLTHFKHFRKNDFEIYVKYHDRYKNKKWLSYEVTPFVDLKRDYDYHTSYGIRLKVSATFGGIKDILNKK